MVNKNIKIYGIRTFLVLVWLFIIFTILYLPYFWPIKGDQKNINVFVWAGLYDLSYISKFEKQTGIIGKFSYYESNEELLVKLSATEGRGYDLILPGDYMVNILRKQGLLKKLDKSKMTFYKNLNPILLGHYFDPNNDYSIPAEWGVFGLGIDKDFFKDKPIGPSWKYIFDTSRIPGKIIMSDDPLVTLPLANLYLFGAINALDKERVEDIKELLIKQRPFIEAYVDLRPDYYLITKICPLVVSSNAYIFRAMKEHDNIDFLIPEEGSLVTIENFAIPEVSEKEELVYKFLNFMLSPETAQHHFEGEFVLMPVTVDVLPKLKVSDTIKSLLGMTRQEFEKFDFFRSDKLKSPLNEFYMQESLIFTKL